MYAHTVDRRDICMYALTDPDSSGIPVSREMDMAASGAILTAGASVPRMSRLGPPSSSSRLRLGSPPAPSGLEVAVLFTMSADSARKSPEFCRLYHPSEEFLCEYETAVS